SAGPWVAGAAMTFTAAVSYAGGVPPDGETIAFSSGSLNLGTATLSGGKASLTTSALGQGGGNVKAAYSGDANLRTAQQTISVSVVAAPKLTLACSAPGYPGPASVSPVTWGLSITNKGPGTAYNVRLAFSTLNGSGGTVTPSTYVGT